MLLDRISTAGRTKESAPAIITVRGVGLQFLIGHSGPAGAAA